MFAEAMANIGNIHAKRSRYTDAVPWLERAIALRPQSGELNNNLGCTLQKLGDVEGAVARFRDTMHLDPANTDAPNNLLFTLNYLDSPDPAELYAEHLRWAERFARAPDATRVWENAPDPERRLRIGYVSPDLWRHSVAYFFEPLIASHERSAMEVFCYADVKKPDEVTGRLRGFASHWRDTRHLPDEQLAAMVQSDKIDILVDLAGHTNNNRLAMFGRRAAPVQVTYLGYPNTTGLGNMDYRLTDAWADPPGLTDAFNTETLVRLPHGFHCYQPDDCAPDPAPPPALANGYVTFGSFNNVMKTSSAVVRAWAAILKEVPRSSLLLKNAVLHEPLARERVIRAFIGEGIDPARIQLDGFKAKRNHLAQYARFDIALDPFPYNGTTTTCESLWMGVPVLALAGQTHAGRVGVSLLSQLGLEEWIASDEQDYVARAVRFAADLPSLSALRVSLRDRMRASSIMDATGLTRDIEAAYRDMWRNWCRSTR
jgi:predicted O-linked N-acetylglucosamine transferase (SPINDLY family)